MTAKPSTLRASPRCHCRPPVTRVYYVSPSTNGGLRLSTKKTTHLDRLTGEVCFYNALDDPALQDCARRPG